MALDIELADLVTLVQHSVVRLDCEPVYVKEVGSRVIYLRRVASQAIFSIPTEEYKRLKPFRGRVGFVNDTKYAVYVERNPVRRYSIGLTSSNCIGIAAQGCGKETSRVVKVQLDFETTGIESAIAGVYPTLSTAMHLARHLKGSVAFDRQFAVCSGRGVYYKTEHVGQLTGEEGRIEDIVFNPGKEHLRILIGDYHDIGNRCKD